MQNGRKQEATTRLTRTVEKMRKECSRKKLDNEKLMPQIIRMLDKQGSMALEQARRRILAIKVESVEAQEGLKLYAKNWRDMIHPALLSLSVNAVSNGTFDVTDLQIVVLLLTAAMDIHDDVMDKSKTKSGKPTLYGKFGESLAILMGDALLMEGFMMLHSLNHSLEAKSYDQIMDIVNNSLFEVGNAHLMELDSRIKSALRPRRF